MLIEKCLCLISGNNRCFVATPVQLPISTVLGGWEDALGRGFPQSSTDRCCIPTEIRGGFRVLVHCLQFPLEIDMVDFSMCYGFFDDLHHVVATLLVLSSAPNFAPHPERARRNSSTRLNYWDTTICYLPLFMGSKLLLPDEDHHQPNFKRSRQTAQM